MKDKIFLLTIEKHRDVWKNEDKFAGNITVKTE